MMKYHTVLTTDLRDMARCIAKVWQMQREYPQVFAPIATEICDAATAIVSISAGCTKEQRKEIFGEDKK